MLVATLLEVQGDCGRGAAEDRDGQRIGHADAHGADIGREQFRLHHRVDRGIAGHEYPGAADQQKGDERRLGGLQRGQDRHRAERAGNAEEDQQRLAAETIRERAIDRLQDAGEYQRAEDHRGGLVGGEADRELHEGLHIGGEGVERGGAAGGEADHQQQLARIGEQRAQRAARLGALLGRFELLGLVHVAAHHRGEDGKAGTDEERNAPAPVLQLLLGEEHLLEQHQHDNCGELTTDQGDVLEARIEAAMVRISDLGEVGSAGAIFTAEAEALDDACESEDDGRCETDGRIGRADRDDQRAEAHAQHGDGERQAPAIFVGEIAEQPAAERAHQEGGGEQHGRIELLHDGIAVRKEGRCEIQRESGVGVEVVPFDEIAHRADEDRLDAFPGVVEMEFAVRRRCE